MFNTFKPRRGSLLLSEPFMLDHNFERSVILLCEHDKNNETFGLVLNNKSNINVCDVLSNFERKDFPIYIGGPVSVDSLFFLHNKGDQIEDSKQLIENIYFGGNLDQTLFLIKENILQPQDIKFFIGYAGWSAGQLEVELEQNSWAVHNKFPTDILLLNDGEDLWKQALISLGPKYAHVANFPRSPHLN